MKGSSGTVPSSDPLLGVVLNGRYRVDRPLGRGGMGVVYEAEHLLIGRKVAVKTMASHAALTPGNVERFQREARVAASVGNSHVVDVLDMGQLDAGSLYIVLEHLDGVDLGFAVAAEGRFSPARALDVLIQLCDALAAVHAAGIIHRDLKPDNIFLITRDGKPDFVKVLDFGICKFLSPEDSRLTASGDVIGTPQFMAPEQIEGRTDLDERTDVHALGAILFFMLTGRPPFEAPNVPKLLLKISTEYAPNLREVDPTLPSALEAIVGRALHRHPDQRYDSCEALKADLLLCTADHDVAATLRSAEPAHVLRSARAALTLDDAAKTSGVTSVPGLPRRYTTAQKATAIALVVALGALLWAASRSGSRNQLTAPTEIADAEAPRAAASEVQPSPALPPPSELLTVTASRAATATASAPPSGALARRTPEHEKAPPPLATASAAGEDTPSPTPSNRSAAPGSDTDAGAADAGPRSAASAERPLPLNRELKRGL